MLFMAHFAVNLNGNQQLTGTLTFRLRAGERSQRNRPQDRSSLFTVGSVKPFKGFTALSLPSFASLCGPCPRLRDRLLDDCYPINLVVTLCLMSVSGPEGSRRAVM
jgi:hypothetical protein